MESVGEERAAQYEKGHEIDLGYRKRKYIMSDQAHPTDWFTNQDFETDKNLDSRFNHHA